MLPSDTETLGVVTLEAQASGLPVIAADSPAARKLIRDGLIGLRFDPAAPGSLANAMGQLAADRPRRAVMSHEAARSVHGCTWRVASAALRRHSRRAREQRPVRPSCRPAASIASGR